MSSSDALASTATLTATSTSSEKTSNRVARTAGGSNHLAGRTAVNRSNTTSGSEGGLVMVASSLATPSSRANPAEPFSNVRLHLCFASLSDTGNRYKGACLLRQKKDCVCSWLDLMKSFLPAATYQPISDRYPLNLLWGAISDRSCSPKIISISTRETAKGEYLISYSNLAKDGCRVEQVFYSFLILDWENLLTATVLSCPVPPATDGRRRRRNVNFLFFFIL